MGKPSDLTPEAMEGYLAGDEDTDPYYNTSASSMAWHVGAWMRRTGRSQPRAVRMSRGYTLHVNDMLVSINHNHEVSRIR